MSRKTLALTDELYQYLLSSSLREPPLLHRLREETNAIGDDAAMQIAPEQGQFMGLLIKLMNARLVLEVGTFTGYSSLSMALALPQEGKLVACDVSKEWTAIARRYWKEAGVENRIELHLGPALETLNKLLANGLEEKFDLAFIDADKENYIGYYEHAMKLLRPGGIVLVDNVLWSGKVLRPDIQDVSALAVRSFNEYIKNDPRITLSILPIADGLTLALKH